ncbi:MAG: hypothetical protein ACO3ST_02495 [Burkholderiaceae bacterium]
MASTYLTVYHKETGEPALTYAATVKEWLAAGYTTTPPKDAKPAPEASRSKLPTAGREANRENPIIQGEGRNLSGSMVDAQKAEVELVKTEAVVEPAPEKPAPRRRSSSTAD